MEIAKQILDQAGILPKLRLCVQVTKPDGSPGGVKGTGPHRVTIKGMKIMKGKDFNSGEEKEIVSLIVIEEDVEKRYVFDLTFCFLRSYSCSL